MQCNTQACPVDAVPKGDDFLVETCPLGFQYAIKESLKSGCYGIFANPQVNAHLQLDHTQSIPPLSRNFFQECTAVGGVVMEATSNTDANANPTSLINLLDKSLGAKMSLIEELCREEKVMMPI